MEDCTKKIKYKLKVSVIIPNYNHAKYIKQRIDSVISQTFKNLEIILLDDCSSDDSREIIKQYESHPLIAHIIINKTNSGSVFKQWKKGIELAQGEYIWIAESDDYADQHFLEKMVPILESDEMLGFAYCNGTIVVDDSIVTNTFAEIRNKSYNTKKWNQNYINEGHQEIKENLMINCTVNNASGVLFRRKALIEIDPFDRELKYIGDWYCYLKLCARYKIAYLNESLNFYREHQVNASKKLQKNLQFINEYFQVYDWAIQAVTSLPKKEIVKLFLAHINHSLLHGFRRHLPLYKKLFLQNPQLFLVMVNHNMKNHRRRFIHRFKF